MERAVPPSPPELVSVYGIRAQMLAPIVRDDRLAGVVSVHYVGGTREWSGDEIAALESAAARIRELLDA